MTLGSVIHLIASGLVVVYGQATPPAVAVDPGGSVLTTTLITVAINISVSSPVDMAFSHDGEPFLPWEPFQPVRKWLVKNPAQTYQTYLAALNGGRAFCDWDNEYGSLAWGESFILDSLLDMYESTGDESYLDEFVVHADAVIAQGDDFAGRFDYRGRSLPGWGTSGPYTLATIDLPDTVGQPAWQVKGRSRLRQNQVAVRLTATDTTTDTLWVLDVHRSMAGRMGVVFSDTTPGTTPPNWGAGSWSGILHPGDSLVYDVYYPWFTVSEIRLYGLQNSALYSDDLELFVAMHADRGEYTRVTPVTLRSLVQGGQSLLAFQDFQREGRYWKVHYVGKQPLVLSADPLEAMRVYEAGFPPVSEQFYAFALSDLATAVEQHSNLVQIQTIEGRQPYASSVWQFLIPQRYHMTLHTGLITYPLLRFAALVERYDLALWRAQGEQYRDYARAAINVHDAEWRSLSATRGYYVFPPDAPVWCNGVNLPYNQQAAIGRSLLLLYDLTHEEVYRTRAMKIAQVLRDGLFYHLETDSYWWYYWFGEGYDGWQDVEDRFIPTYEGFKGVEPIYYASIDSDFARLMHAHGLVFSDYDILRLSNTFLHRLTTPEGQVHCYVNGDTFLKPQPDEQVDISAICTQEHDPVTTEFLALTEVAPAVYQRVEMVHPLPMARPEDMGRAPYSLARLIYYATWRLSPGRGDHSLCVQVRTEPGLVSGPWCAYMTLNLWRYYLPLLSQSQSQETIISK